MSEIPQLRMHEALAEHIDTGHKAILIHSRALVSQRSTNHSMCNVADREKQFHLHIPCTIPDLPLEKGKINWEFREMSFWNLRFMNVSHLRLVGALLFLGYSQSQQVWDSRTKSEGGLSHPRRSTGHSSTHRNPCLTNCHQSHRICFGRVLSSGDFSG